MEELDNVLCVDKMKKFLVDNPKWFNSTTADILLNSYCVCLDLLFRDTGTCVQDVFVELNDDSTIAINIECWGFSVVGNTEFLVNLFQRCVKFGVRKGNDPDGSVILSFVFPSITPEVSHE